MAPVDDKVRTLLERVGTESSESKSLTTLPAKPPNKRGPGLYDIFSNSILLASLLTNFSREDYNLLANVAASIPGLKQQSPAWDPYVLPCPRRLLPFNIGSLRVQCHATHAKTDSRNWSACTPGIHAVRVGVSATLVWLYQMPQI